MSRANTITRGNLITWDNTITWGIMTYSNTIRQGNIMTWANTITWGNEEGSWQPRVGVLHLYSLAGTEADTSFVNLLF